MKGRESDNPGTPISILKHVTSCMPELSLIVNLESRKKIILLTVLVDEEIPSFDN